MSNNSSEIGLIGLAVMGQNLALNIADHGFKISVYNRTFEKTSKFLEANGNVGNLTGCEDIKDLWLPYKNHEKLSLWYKLEKLQMQ
jgi:6-phosphogluconate dehydrogenase